MVLRISRFLSLVVLLLLVTGCSKNVFRPDQITGNEKLTKEYQKEVLAQHKAGITYRDGSFVTTSALQQKKLPEGFAYINENSDYFIAADVNTTVLLLNKKDDTVEQIVLPRRLLSAALQKNLLVGVDSKNTIYVYDVKSKSMVYTFDGADVVAVDQRLANPYFYQELIFIPTLDGKVQFYALKTSTIVREMSVSSEDHFNNIIFFHVNEKENRLYVATATKFYLFGAEKKEVVVPIRSIMVEDEQSFLLFSKDGFINRYDVDLNLKASLKVKFAHFLGAMKNGSLVVAEKEGYLLKVTNDLSSYTVYKLPFDEGNFFSSKEGFYFINGYYKP